MMLTCTTREHIITYLIWGFMSVYQIQSTLVISKLKGTSETLQDIRTATYQRGGRVVR